MALNPQNLRPPRTKDEARSRGRAGGLASGRRRRELKTLRDSLGWLLSQRVADGSPLLAGFASVLAAFGMRGAPTARELACLALVVKVLRGDVSAFVALRDTVGERPVERREELVPPGPPVVLGLFGPPQDADGTPQDTPVAPGGTTERENAVDAS